MKQLIVFIERSLEEKDIIRLNFFSEPDGPVMGNGAFRSSTLVPGKKEAFYVSPPSREKLPKNASQGSVLLGAISYGKLTSARQEEAKNPQKNPASYQVYYLLLPNKVDEDNEKGPTNTTKPVSERLEEEVRDAKIKVLSSLKQDTEKELSEWRKLSSSLKSEYPNYTPLLAKILEGVCSRSNIEDKICHSKDIIEAADEVIASIDTEELAKFLSLKCDPEDEEAEKTKKKMETIRDQLAEGLYQKGLALAEIENLGGKKVATEGKTGADASSDQSGAAVEKADWFEDNFKELQKWVDVKSSKYGTLSVIREKRRGRLGTALKALNDMIQEDGDPPKKKLYEMELSLLEEIRWTHLATHKREWMHVRFPACLPLF